MSSAYPIGHGGVACPALLAEAVPSMKAEGVTSSATSAGRMVAMVLGAYPSVCHTPGHSY